MGHLWHRNYIKKQIAFIVKFYEQGFFFVPGEACIGAGMNLDMEVRLEAES